MSSTSGLPLHPEKAAAEYLEMLCRQRLEREALLASAWDVVGIDAKFLAEANWANVLEGTVIYESLPEFGKYTARIVIRKVNNGHVLCHTGEWVSFHGMYVYYPKNTGD